MGIKTTQVWLLATVCLAPLVSASLCPRGLQYWSDETESCINCSRCDVNAKHVVIRPCQIHSDTVCGPISDLNIDWSWLKPINKHHNKHHKHQHFSDLSDDIETTPLHHSVLDDDVETFPSLNKHRGGRKHHKHGHESHEGELEESLKKPIKHHISSESLLSDDFEPATGDHRINHKLPPPPPLKSTDDLEKEWKAWLVQSKNQLQLRKEDLLKNLHNESPHSEKHHAFKLNYPNGNAFDDTEEVFHHSGHHGHKKHFSPLDLEIFDRLLTHEHQRLSLSRLLNAENKRNDDKDRANDLSYPMDSFDFRSAVPTHRLFLGEPSTVSEIMDQDLSEEEEDESLPEDRDPGVIAVPFSAAETLIWDWQAVALASAVAACLLFFAVVAGYSLLHARQWKRLKTNLDTDMEELSVKVGLMGSSAAEAANTNLYLEKLLENKKNTSNIYTQKRPSS